MNTVSIKSRIPWHLKIISKIILSRIPVGYKFWQRMGLFRHGEMDKADYALKVFKTHVSQANIKDKLRNKTLLELGPGDSIASAIIAKSYGAKIILVDTGNYADANIDIYQPLIKKLLDKNLSPPSLENLKNLSDLLKLCDAKYLTSGLNSFRDIDNESIDFIYSHAVLEHIRKHEFLDLMHECERVLKPNGTASHQIDLRDHLGGGLNNLRFSENIWESNFFSNSGFYTNRIQFSKMVDLFESANFSVLVTNIERWDEMPTPRKNLAAEFRTLPEQELNVYSFAVVLSKTNG